MKLKGSLDILDSKILCICSNLAILAAISVVEYTEYEIFEQICLKLRLYTGRVIEKPNLIIFN